jgi:pyruvate,water dikinase
MVFGHRADLDAARDTTVAWASSIPDEPDDRTVVALARGFAPRMAGELRSLLEASFGAAIPSSILERLASRIRDEPGLLIAAMSGLGGIETSQPAHQLWRLGSVVGSSPSLTALFDEGVNGLPDRLAAGEDPDLMEFRRQFDSFLGAHGHRGPNEMELASSTWGTDPKLALAVVERLRFTDEGADPAQAARRLAEARRDAQARLAASVPAALRPIVARLFEKAARGTARRERAKGTIVLAVAALRRPLFRRADQLVRDGHLPDRTQFFMATLDELPTLLADPGSLATELSLRRERYEELNALVPPFAFDGRLPDPATWPRRAEGPAAAELDETTLTGIGVSGGSARGRARVVTDPEIRVASNRGRSSWHR